MVNQKIDDVFNTCLKTSKEILTEQGSLTPILHLVSEKSGNILIQLQSLDENKYQIMSKIGTEMAKKFDDIIGIIFVSEGWASKYEKNILDENGKLPEELPMPSKDPKRIEVLTIIGIDNQNNKIKNYFYEMIRDNENKITLKDFCGDKKNDWKNNDEQDLKINILNYFIKSYNYYLKLNSLFKNICNNSL